MAAKILVIEDERSVLQSTLQILALEGYDVRGASNGRDGVAYAREYLPDLVICDIMMPGMNGYEVLATLRDLSVTALTPFIFLTARADRRDVRRGMNLGADDYLTKPFTAAELIDSIEARLRISQKVQRITEERLNQLRNSVLLAVPHELRTPLTSVLGFSEMMISEGLALEPEQMVQMARYIYTAAERLSRLVENHLLYAQTEIMRLDAGHADIFLNGTCQTCKAVEPQALETASRAGRLSDLRLEVRDAVAAIREEYLRKIVAELVDNACRFSAEATPVLVRGAVSGGVYALEIADHGRGMSAEEIASIGTYIQFGRAYYEQQGAGLGLIIARRLAEIHGGRLDVTSAPGRGTTVRVEVPLA
ncbi:MAG: hybrid sensor histidine kinase/response regulator [Aggregatilineales bacterium]